LEFENCETDPSPKGEGFTDPLSGVLEYKNILARKICKDPGVEPIK